MASGNLLRGGGIRTAGVRNRRAASLTRPASFLLLAVAILGVSGLGLSSSGFGVASGIQSLAKARSMLALLAERSPGPRTSAELTKTKRKLATARPHERALGKIRRPVLPPEFLKALAPEFEIADTPPVVNLNTLLDLPAPQFALAGPPPVGLPGGSPGAPIPGGGGSASPPQTGDTPTPTPTPPSAVPEPGTWAMMLLGFFCMGMQLKRARRKAVAPLRIAM